MRTRGDIAGTGLSGFGLGAVLVGVAVAGLGAPVTAPAGTPQTTEHLITINATALEPPTWWYVPGVTPIIWSLDPDSTEAYRTTEVRQIKLKPGAYRFGTFTFDFPFVITLDGKVEFPSTLDECVEGRGTQSLTIRCSRTMPYGGNPEY
jgi:hypothetical protein